MASAELDYQLAWRWLVPVRDRTVVSTIGLPEEADALFPVGPVAPASKAENDRKWRVLVADLRSEVLPKGEAEKHDALCVVATRGVASSLLKSLGAEWRYLRAYGLIPEKAPRLAIPLSSGRVAREGLQLHRPGRPLPRLAVSVLKLLTHVGIVAPLRKQILLVAARTDEVSPLGLSGERAQDVGCCGSDEFAVYFGACGRDRKTVALRIGRNSRELLKTGWGEQARVAIQAEHAALLAMAETPLSANVPSVNGFVLSENRAALTQEYRLRRFVFPWRFSAAVKGFLCQLSEIDVRTVSLSDWVVKQGHADLAGGRKRLLDVLLRRASQDMSIRLHREHGDFAPWNVSWDGKRLFVFDWERSVPTAPALSDAFYFAAAPALYVGEGHPAGEILDRMRKFARSVSDVDGVELEVYLGVWLFSRAEMVAGEKAPGLVDQYLRGCG